MVVEMTLTTPGCPASENLLTIARAAIVEALSNEVTVDVRVVWEPQWSPGIMDAIRSAALALRVRR